MLALQKQPQKLLLQQQKDQYEQQKKQRELQLQQHKYQLERQSQLEKQQQMFFELLFKKTTVEKTSHLRQTLSQIPLANLLTTLTKE